ncbi:HEAT repeat domain-containing protein [Spirosoma sp. KUDC1026]|uniref:HEAT repeat domain-containing protein n=1 Tax=Spirosoma sp. KUDC1026 TaxID=2745947 RepID=UPI00159BCA0F|nr:HEAT repeat domain-containing protein [Spirosoma sp. KUDC1026]QKZ14760.1 HEAT repeat domain-containing protein [Spirosoma sp. KUDC1026]
MKPTIEELLNRYYAGETTVAEENVLRDYFRYPEQVPTELRQHAPLFNHFSDAQAQQSSTDLFAPLERQAARPRAKIRQLTSWGLRLAASVTLLLIGFAAGWLYNQPDPDQEASGMPAQATSIKKVLAFDAMAHTSASDRIQAVNQSYELDQADREITQLLINTLNFDANVNVRLAACQALMHYENEEGVREALIQSLRIQKDPNVQLTLIESLVAIKERRAATDMQRLARNQQVLDIVRLKAQEGAGVLMASAHS